jgi:hypothetical protein
MCKAAHCHSIAGDQCVCLVLLVLATTRAASLDDEVQVPLWLLRVWCVQPYLLFTVCSSFLSNGFDMLTVAQLSVVFRHVMKRKVSREKSSSGRVLCCCLHVCNALVLCLLTKLIWGSCNYQVSCDYRGIWLFFSYVLNFAKRPSVKVNWHMQRKLLGFIS